MRRELEVDGIVSEWEEWEDEHGFQASTHRRFLFELVEDVHENVISKGICVFCDVTDELIVIE